VSPNGLVHHNHHRLEEINMRPFRSDQTAFYMWIPVSANVAAGRPAQSA